jgi:murein DD-endopeptidase MepM/ murein hydrolase activator NlpD
MLAYESISEIWEQVEDLQQFQVTLRANLDELRSLKDELVSSRSEQEAKRRQLLNYDQELVEQDRALQLTKNEKSSLLSQTKNKESNYLLLIEEKKTARAEFERELLDFESQLKFALDPDSIPTAKRGVLAWPVENVRITQTFGDTNFARGGAYNGKGHNGIDFGLPTGSRVKAALSGTVAATGNTDAFRGCYSYGKWVLIHHNNGLSTLYAHLSGIALPEGSEVFTGQTIGYSGNTGYSTGPHLHFSVFATQGVQIVRFGDIKEITNCSDAYVPVAPLAAYLDPLSYLEE